LVHPEGPFLDPEKDRKEKVNGALNRQVGVLPNRDPHDGKPGDKNVNIPHSFD
jgi:hypothetical protein